MHKLVPSALLLLAACANAPSPATLRGPATRLPEPDRSPLSRPLEGPAPLDAQPEVEAARDPEPAAEPRAAAPPIPPNTAVLHIGDSFVLAGFSQALKPRLKELGVRYKVSSEQSSYTVTWAAKLEQLVADTQPDLVIITLGANEVANVNPPAHAPAVRRMVKIIGQRPCVWVSPPLWRKDTGIIDVIRENTAPCRYFDSDRLVPQPLPRQADKIHPSVEGGAIWAAAFWAWLEKERVPAGEARPATLSPWALRPGTREEHLPRIALGEAPGDSSMIGARASASDED